MLSLPIFGSWWMPAQTQSANTAIAIFVPPFTRGTGGMANYTVNTAGKAPNALQATGAPTWQGKSAGVTHVTSLMVTTGSTAHSIFVLRPLNWTYFTVAAAANATTITVKDDPGAYSTTYRYPLAAGQTTVASVGNRTTANLDYVAFQLVDGTWYFGTITGAISSNVLTLTTAIPNVTGGGVAINTPLFFFGVGATDVDPATGMVQPNFQPKVSLSNVVLMQDAQFGGVSALNRGDPLIIYDLNSTAADTIVSVGGYYADV